MNELNSLRDELNDVDCFISTGYERLGLPKMLMAYRHAIIEKMQHLQLKNFWCGDCTQ